MTLAVAAFAVDTGPAHASREPTAADGLRLNAQAAAVLARESSDARAAYAAVLRHYSLDPGRPGLRADVLRYAVLTGDRARATSIAAAIWKEGSRSLEIRAILTADAVQRGDWRRARELTDSSADKTRTASNLLGDVIGGWIDVAQRSRNPATGLRARIAGRDADPALQVAAASILIASGDVSGGRAIAERISLADGEARAAARRLVPQLAAAGASDLLSKRLEQVERVSTDAAALFAATPGEVTPAQGIAVWLGILAEGADSPIAANRRAALAFARSAVWLAPRDMQLRLTLADLLEKSDQPDLALDALAPGDGAAADRAPVLVRLRRAELMVAVGETDRGLESARALAGRTDSSLDVRLRYLNLLRAQKHMDAVATELDSLLAAALPESSGIDRDALTARLCIARAEIWLAQGQWDAAKPLLDRAVAAQPDNADVLNFAGYSAIEARRDVDASFSLIEHAWRMDPDNAAIIDSLGWAHFLMGRAEQAVSLLDRAARRAPDNAVINEHLGDALWTVGRRFEARYAWQAAAITAEGRSAERVAAKARGGLTPELVSP